MKAITLCAFLYFTISQSCSQETGKFENQQTEILNNAIKLISSSDIQQLLSSSQAHQTALALFEGIMGFFRRVGIFPSPASPYCYTLAQDYYNGTIKAINQIFTPNSLLMGVVNVIQSIIEIKVMYQKCPVEVEFFNSKLKEYSHLSYFTVSERIFNRSGIIAYNIFNSIYGISADDYYRAGAWIGSGIYNVLNADIKDDPIFGNNYD